MTNPGMALAELAEKGSDVDVLHQMVQFMVQRLDELAKAFGMSGISKSQLSLP